MIRCRNKSGKQKEKEAMTKVKQNDFNTVYIGDLQEKFTKSDSDTIKGETDVLDQLHFEYNVKNGIDIDDDSIEALMMPDIFKSNGNGFQEVSRAISKKIDKLFDAPKFHQQKENMDLCFTCKMTLAEIEAYTRNEEAFELLTEEEMDKKIKKRVANISRSINLGLEKIKKHLTETEWNKVKFQYGVKC